MCPSQPMPLLPAMGVAEAPTWAGALWIGQLDRNDSALLAADRVPLAGGEGYRRARLLIRDGAVPQAFVEVAVTDGAIAADDLRTAMQGLDPVEPLPVFEHEPFITIAVSTRNRPDYVRTMLPSLTSMDYGRYEILFVDNASSTDETFDYVSGIDDPRVRIVREPRPGLSRGRNKALLEANGDIVAFTDDDVIVDPHWLRAVATGFGRDARTGLVTGMVPSGEMRSSAQWYFESRSSWIHSCLPRVYTLDNPPADVRAFPLDMSRYGTGANFAVRRDLAIELGGFNEALGVGSPTGGGEDLDMFVRVLYAGHALAYEPSSIVWHRHRDDLAALQHQMSEYALSFSAWMTSLLANPDVRADAVRIGARHVRRRIGERLSRTAPATTEPAPTLDSELAALPGVERSGLLRGPAAYLRARRSGLQPRPLAESRARS